MQGEGGQERQGQGQLEVGLRAAGAGACERARGSGTHFQTAMLASC